MEETMRLKDKIALVTGASRGIGYASCLALAQGGRDDRRHRAHARRISRRSRRRVAGARRQGEDVRVRRHEVGRRRRRA